MSIQHSILRGSWMAAVALTLGAYAQTGPSVADQGRTVAKQVAPAVITIRLVKKNTSSYEGQSSTRETKSEVPAVIIDGTGLAVTSLMNADPAGMYAAAAGDGFSSRSEIIDAKYVMPDGTEVAAGVVLRDKDLDLLFLRPTTKPAAEMAHIDLTNPGTVDLFDPVVLFTRMGKVVNRTLGAKIVNIQGVVSKPRLRYIIGTEDVTALGCPVLTLDGKTVGLLVVRMTKTSADSMDGIRDGDDGAAPVILTCADLAKAAAGAPLTAPKTSVKATPITPKTGTTPPKKTK